MEVVQYIGVTSVLWVIASVLWGIASVLWRLFSAVGITLVHISVIISVLWGDNINTVEGYLQYCGGIRAVYVGIASVLSGILSALWRLFSTVADSFSTVGDNISTVEGIQYSREKILISAEKRKDMPDITRKHQF